MSRESKKVLGALMHEARPRPQDLDRGIHVQIPDPPYLYRLRAGAGDVGLSPRTISNAIRTGDIQAFRFGASKVVLLRPADVRRWADARLRPYKNPGIEGASE